MTMSRRQFCSGKRRVKLFILLPQLQWVFGQWEWKNVLLGDWSLHSIGICEVFNDILPVYFHKIVLTQLHHFSIIHFSFYCIALNPSP